MAGKQNVNLLQKHTRTHTHIPRITHCSPPSLSTFIFPPLSPWLHALGPLLTKIKQLPRCGSLKTHYRRSGRTDWICVSADAKLRFSRVRRLYIKTIQVSSLIIDRDRGWLINSALIRKSVTLWSRTRLWLNTPITNESNHPGVRGLQESFWLCCHGNAAHPYVTFPQCGEGLDVMSDICLQLISDVCHVLGWQMTPWHSQRWICCCGSMIKFQTLGCAPLPFPPSLSFPASCQPPPPPRLG